MFTIYKSRVYPKNPKFIAVYFFFFCTASAQFLNRYIVVRIEKKRQRIKTEPILLNWRIPSDKSDVKIKQKSDFSLGYFA